jgi:ankyrin repeat protein
MVRLAMLVTSALLGLSLQVAAQDLHEAARLGDAAAVSLELEEGADVNSRSKAGFTPLELAALNGHPDVVSLLLQAGADPAARREGDHTILMKAAAQRYSKVVEMLLEAGADPDASDANGITAVVSAASGGDPQVVQMLLAATSAVNDALPEALLRASRAGHTDVVRGLLKNGATPEATDSVGVTSLMGAAMEGHTSIVEALLEAGAEPEAKDYQRKQTALCWAACRGRAEAARALAARGADVNATDSRNNSALLLAVTFGRDLPTIDVLLKSGGDPSIGNYKGLTPLAAAVSLKRPEAAEALLLGGADPDVTYDGEPILEIARRQGSDEIVALLERAQSGSLAPGTLGGSEETDGEADGSDEDTGRLSLEDILGRWSEDCSSREAPSLFLSREMCGYRIVHGKLAFDKLAGGLSGVPYEFEGDSFVVPFGDDQSDRMVFLFQDSNTIVDRSSGTTLNRCSPIAEDEVDMGVVELGGAGRDACWRRDYGEAIRLLERSRMVDESGVSVGHIPHLAAAYWARGDITRGRELLREVLTTLETSTEYHATHSPWTLGYMATESRRLMRFLPPGAEDEWGDMVEKLEAWKAKLESKDD